MSNERTWRESRINIPGQIATRFAEGNTRPNYFIIVNNSAETLFVGVSPNVDNTSFEIVVPAMGTRTYARPDPPHELWFFATGAATVYIGSMEKEFDPSMINQTQEIAGVAANGMLGVVDIRSILNALPAGANLIGSVDIASLPALPVGGNLIGSVNLNDVAAGILAQPAGSILVYNIETTAVNTEYSIVIPDGTKRLEISCQENDAAFYVSFVTGKVAAPTAPYIVKQAGENLIIDNVYLVGKTLYFASAALKNIQVICQV